MAAIFQSIEQLAAVLSTRDGIIAIDGATGVGKSTLADDLAKRINADILHLDDFLPDDPPEAEASGPYVEHLALDRILESINRSGAKVLIVEGVCVREVLRRLHLTGHHVYMKRINPHGFWGDETMCDRARILEAEECCQIDRLNPLDTEIRAYHREHDPAGNAAVVYERVTT